MTIQNSSLVTAENSLKKKKKQSKQKQNPPACVVVTASQDFPAFTLCSCLLQFCNRKPVPSIESGVIQNEIGGWTR